MPTFSDYKRTVRYTYKKAQDPWYKTKHYDDYGNCFNCGKHLQCVHYEQELSEDQVARTKTFIAACEDCFKDKFLKVTNKVEQLSKRYGLYPKTYNSLDFYRKYNTTYFLKEDVENKAVANHKVETIDDVFKLMDKKKDAKLAPRKEEVEEWFGDNLDKVEKSHPYIKTQIERFIETGKGSVREMYEEWEGLVFIEEKTTYNKLYELISRYCHETGNYASINWIREESLDEYIKEHGEEFLIDFPPYCQRLYKGRHPQVIFPDNDDDEPIVAIGGT